MTWDNRYIINRATSKTASIGASGIDYSLMTPCSGNKECGACKHIQDVMAQNKDEETGTVIDQDTHAIHQRALDYHQNVLPTNAKPKLATTASQQKCKCPEHQTNEWGDELGGWPILQCPKTTTQEADIITALERSEDPSLAREHSRSPEFRDWFLGEH